MKALRLNLLVLGIGCALIFFSFHSTTTVTDEGDVFQFRMGFDPSPWVKREVRDGVGSLEINLCSWSLAFGLAAVGSLLAYGQLRSVARKPEKVAAAVPAPPSAVAA